MGGKLKNKVVVGVVMSAKKQSTLKDCSTCVMYEYHSYLLPEKIITERQKHWDEILTKACNNCTVKDYRNYHSMNDCELNDEFVEKLELKLRRIKNDSEERKISEKHD